MATESPPFIIGWQEWLALPELGLPAIKAKIDTGARTSALHAFLIEPFGSANTPMVRFGVHPIPGRLDIAIFASAAISDRREVTSSNGERETRYFIRSTVRLGDREWEIEVGLTNRESMAYRMLLGRQAIRDDMMVDAATSFRQPRLTYKLYRGVPRSDAVRRALRIALVASEPGGDFTARLEEEAVARGHSLEALELDHLALSFEQDGAVVLLDGVPLAHYDGVIPRIGRREGAAGAAVIRQLEATGCMALNPGDAIDRVSNRLAAGQALASERIPQVLVRDGLRKPWAPKGVEQMRVLVIGGEAVAMISGDGPGRRAASLARHRAERRLAEHAATALGLGLASIGIQDYDERPVVAQVSARPAFSQFARLARIEVAGDIFDALEALVRPRSRFAKGLLPVA